MTGALGNFATPWVEEFSWPWTLTVTALAATMAVKTLVTGLIVFKIFKGFLKVKRTLGSISSAADYQHIAFIVVESGMALFATHLARIVLTILSGDPNAPNSSDVLLGFDLIVPFHQMINVIISSVYFYSFVLLITFIWLGHRTNNNFGAGLIGIVLRWRRVLQGKPQFL